MPMEALARLEPVRGLEPLTFRLQVECATNCATPATLSGYRIGSPVPIRPGSGCCTLPGRCPSSPPVPTHEHTMSTHGLGSLGGQPSRSATVVALDRGR